MRWLLLFFVTVFGFEQAEAHARWSLTGSTVPRSSSAGIKNGPCGGVPRTMNPAIFSPGATITVQWEETVNHPGRYEIYFSPSGDTGWVLLSTIADMQDGGGLPHQYSAMVTLPNVNCTGCTLQLIQVMMDTGTPSYYYSCADIQLGATSAPPSPPPAPTCP